jgi:hypothetical protein
LNFAGCIVAEAIMWVHVQKTEVLWHQIVNILPIFIQVQVKIYGSWIFKYLSSFRSSCHFCLTKMTYPKILVHYFAKFGYRHTSVTYNVEQSTVWYFNNSVHANCIKSKASLKWNLGKINLVAWYVTQNSFSPCIRYVTLHTNESLMN